MGAGRLSQGGGGDGDGPDGDELTSIQRDFAACGQTSWPAQRPSASPMKLCTAGVISRAQFEFYDLIPIREGAIVTTVVDSALNFIR